MRNKTMIVAAKEQEYVRRAAEYMRDSSAAADWQVTAFTNPQALKQYLRSGYPADFIAAQPAFLEEAEDAMPERVPACSLVLRVNEAGKYPQVLQFQPLPKLLHELQGIYSGAAGVSALPGISRGQTVLIAVYSATGGIGKTTLALNMAQQAAGDGRRVFYLNLELWNSSGVYFGNGLDSGENDFSNMLYALQSQPEKAGALFASLRKHHPVVKTDYFAQAPAPEERQALTPELLKHLLDVIMNHGGYDMVIVDLDGMMDAVHLQALESCNLMFWLGCTDPAGLYKSKTALGYGRRKWGDAYTRHECKMRFLQVGNSEAGSIKDVDGTSPDWPFAGNVRGILPYIPQWRQTGHPMQLLASPVYRGSVRRVLEAWVWPKGGDTDDRGGGAGAAGPYSGENRPERIGNR
ncbi:AAA family ATPase [Paenibacillus tarimensis]